MSYLLDTNIFIQAKNDYYGFDLCPGFWDWLERENQAGKVFSIDRVKDELEKGSDELSQWTKRQGKNFFLALDISTINAMKIVSAWVNSQPYRDFAKRDFLSGADPFLIAYAQAHNHTVVSHEVFKDGELRKVKIPAVCRDLNIPYIRAFEMLRKEKVSFILSP